MTVNIVGSKIERTIQKIGNDSLYVVILATDKKLDMTDDCHREFHRILLEDPKSVAILSSPSLSDQTTFSNRCALLEKAVYNPDTGNYLGFILPFGKKKEILEDMIKLKKVVQVIVCGYLAPYNRNPLKTDNRLAKFNYLNIRSAI